MGKRNAAESLDHSAAAAHTTPQKKQKLDPDVKAVTETPPQTYTLTKDLVEDTVLVDLNLQKWRVGQPIGKGSFGEIFLASDDVSRPVTHQNAKYVAKIEPHSNGPLFVEIHCLMNTAKVTEESPLPDGMPEYIASGSHLFRNEKYRFLILPRFKYDLHSVVKVHQRLDQKNLLVVASQILDILQHLHDSGYVHSDIKAENLMVGNPVEGRRRRQQRLFATTSSTNSTSISSASSTMTLATSSKASTVKLSEVFSQLAESKNRNGGAAANKSHSLTAAPIEYSGSNPVRRCRFKSSLSNEAVSQNYHEMVSRHYLRPLKQINYNDDSETSSDAFGGGKGAAATQGNGGFCVPDVYNSNSNISTMSNNSSCSSSGISSIANPAQKGRNGAGRNTRRGRPAKFTSAAGGGGAGGKKFRVISESNEDDDGEENARFGGSHHRHHHHQRDEEEPEEDSSVDGDRIYLIDFGLASKFVDTNGVHRPFFMDERRAHDGTLEFTSRDAHLGAHARRSDLECLGYNLILWAQGNLPWRNEKLLQQPEEVHHMKEFFMSNVKETMKLCYGPQVPKYLGVYMDYVNRLMYTDRPDYDYCRSIFRNEFKRLGYNAASDFHLDLEPLRVVQKVVEENGGGGVGGRGRRNGRLNGVNGGAAAATITPSIALDSDVPDSGGCLKALSTPCGNEQLLAKFGLMVPSIKDSSSKISPKNLRSKKPAPKKNRRKLSWEELLATDPEQIARQRIEKEFDEQDSNLEVSVKYQGKPTYAILELENKLNNTLTAAEEEQQDESMAVDGDATFRTVHGLNESFLEVGPIKGYTKPMMDIVRRRHSNLMRSLIANEEEEEEEDDDEDEDAEEDEVEDEEGDESVLATTTIIKTPVAVQNGVAKRTPMLENVQTPTTPSSAMRRKAGLRPHVKPTSKSLFYHKNLLKQKLMDARKQEKRRLATQLEDENSNSNTSSTTTSGETVREKKRSTAGSAARKRYEDDDEWGKRQIKGIQEVADEEEEEDDSEEAELEEDSDEEEREGEEAETDLGEEDEEDEEELLSDNNSEEEEESSNSCDREDEEEEEEDVAARGGGRKRNTRLTRTMNCRWNGAAGVTSSRFNERGKPQRMITRG